MEMGVGVVIMGVSPPAIGVSVGGRRLPQITVVEGFVGRESLFRRVSSLFGYEGKKHERKNAKIYHSQQVGRPHRLRKKDTSFLRSSRKDWKVGFIPTESCMCKNPCEGEWGRRRLGL